MAFHRNNRKVVDSVTSFVTKDCENHTTSRTLLSVTPNQPNFLNLRLSERPFPGISSSIDYRKSSAPDSNAVSESPPIRTDPREPPDNSKYGVSRQSHPERSIRRDYFLRSDGMCCCLNEPLFLSPEWEHANPFLTRPHLYKIRTEPAGEIQRLIREPRQHGGGKLASRSRTGSDRENRPLQSMSSISRTIFRVKY